MILNKFSTLKSKVIDLKNRFEIRAKPKIFCIGFNKTGTTSLKKALEEMGIMVGIESEAKNLIDSWIIRDFHTIIQYCRTAQAFQDSPFSFPYTYVALDYAYPKSKFILTVRDDPEQWYNSLTSFHTKLWSTKKGQTPSKEDLKNAFNSTKGRPWKVNRALFNSPENSPYEKDMLIDFYENHNKSIINYFKNRQEDLLILNVSKKGSYKDLASFLEVKTNKTEFPWENKTYEKK